MESQGHFPLKACVLAALLLGFVADRAHAQGVPTRAMPRIDQIGEWRAHDPERPEPGYEPWTPTDAARFLARYGEAIFQIDARASYPPGNTFYTRKSAHVADLRTQAQEIGTVVDGRLCIGLRPDVLHSFRQGNGGCDVSSGGGGCDWEGDMDGRFGERERVIKVAGRATGGSETELFDATANWWPERWRHRLVVLRPGEWDEEARRVVASDSRRLAVDRPWTRPPRAQDRFEIRGSFDEAWIQRVPRSVHDDTVRRLWYGMRDVCPGGCRFPAEPLDPLGSGNRRGWPAPMDREGVFALAKASTVPALYGFVADDHTSDPRRLVDPYFRVSGLVMRIDDPDYRHWKTRYVLYKLRDHGFAPGDTPCIVVSYKPGWHAFYDEATHGPSPEVCAVAGSNLWTGPTHVCQDDHPRRLSPGGPFHPTQFRPGRFEAGISAFLLELIATLEQAGYRQPRIITVERPRYRNRYWSVLSEAVIRHPALAGELGRSIEPRLPQSQPRPAAPPAAAPGSPPSGELEDADSGPPDPGGAPSGGSLSTPTPAGGTPQPGGGSARASSRQSESRTQSSGGTVRSSGGWGGVKDRSQP